MTIDITAARAIIDATAAGPWRVDATAPCIVLDDNDEHIAHTDMASIYEQRACEGIARFIDAALLGPTEPPPNMSAELARVVRAVRVNVVMRERLEARCAGMQQRTVDVESRVVEEIAKWLDEGGLAQPFVCEWAARIRAGEWKTKPCL